MSLRPNKRVKVSQLISGDVQDESDHEMLSLEEEDEEFVAGVESEDDIVVEKTISYKIEQATTLTLDESEVKELSNREIYEDGANRKRTRKKIMYHPKLAAQMRRETLSTKSDDYVPSKVNILQTQYSDNKEWICVACSAEMDPNKITKYTDIFTAVTRRGKSLKDLLTSIVKENLDESMMGRKICPSCLDSLNQIEFLYASFRSAADNFLDKYLLGQRTLDADLAGVQQINDLTVLHGSWNLPLNDIVIKVFDNLDLFKAHMHGHQDFGMVPSRIYSGSIQSESGIPEPSDENQMIITFDYATGQICRADNYVKAQVEPAQLENSNAVAVLYISEKEFDETKKVLADDKLYISIEDFGRLNPMVILGQKTTYLQMLLSQNLASKYRQQIPSAKNSFCCCDCGSSFHHLHNLANHIQSVHVDATNIEEVTVDNGIVALNSNQTGTENDPTRTGEIATLEKPFQCEHCDKCFSDYHNFSNHVEHYHGFERKCNVSGCDVTCKSIQEFVQHYVRHTEPNFVLPTEFKEKTQIALPCPCCNASMNGIWRFYNHTFIHDTVQRFKCPACPKRLAKVQNFKLHLIKHLTPSNQKAKVCKHCNQLVPLAIFGKHLREMHENTIQYNCPQCFATFSRETYLKFHMEKHIPKSNWIWFCKLCTQAFPSETRLKSHEMNSHQHDLLCRHCNQPFSGRNELKEHVASAHNSRIFGCSLCQVKEYSLSAAREHFRTVHGDRPFKCHKCNNTFETMIDVHAHINSVHGEMLALENQEDYSCLTCQVPLKTGTYFFKMYTDYSLKNYIFIAEPLLVNHIRNIHLSESAEVNNETFKKISEEFGDHIVEYESEEKENFIRIHSIL